MRFSSILRSLSWPIWTPFSTQILGRLSHYSCRLYSNEKKAWMCAKIVFSDLCHIFLLLPMHMWRFSFSSWQWHSLLSYELTTCKQVAGIVQCLLIYIFFGLVKLNIIWHLLAHLVSSSLESFRTVLQAVSLKSFKIASESLSPEYFVISTSTDQSPLCSV